MDLTAKLKELIKNSPTLKSLSPDEMKFRAEAMLNADPQAQAEFVKVLEQETAQINKIDEAYAKEAGDLLAEAKGLEKEANSLLRHEQEDSAKAEEDASADDILKQLDQV